MSDFQASTIPKFNPPGFPSQDDNLNDEQKSAWSDTISSWMTGEINGSFSADEPLTVSCGNKGVNRTPLTQFFNGTVTPFNTSQKGKLISWIAFPKLVKVRTSSDIERWREADATRNNQDEYCEWTVQKDSDNNIVSVTFTSEGPEYWEFLSQNDPDKMLALFKKYNPDFASLMNKEDFFDKRGQYNPYNKWNGVLRNSGGLTTVTPGCIMHLAQPNNTLSAEIDIAAQGTVLRKDKQGKAITDPTVLCNCSRYGVATRNSDPTIGDQINSLARNGMAVSVADPVGVYMVDFSPDSFQLDVDGTGNNLVDPPKDTFTWVRGDVSKHQGLRLHVEIPKGTMGTGDNAGRQLTVSDMIDTNNSQYVKYGAQFADYIHVGLSGVVMENVPISDALPCPCAGVKAEAAAATEFSAASARVGSKVFASMALADGSSNQIHFRTRTHQ